MKRWTNFLFVVLPALWTWQSCTETAKEPIEPAFVVQPHAPDSVGMYLCELFVQTGEYRIKLDEVVNCDTAGATTALDLPEGAIDVAGGWWAGAGAWYALVPDSAGWAIYQRLEDEMLPVSEWRLFARLDQSGKLLPPPFHPSQLVGFYARQREEGGTEVLFLGMNGGLLEGKLFQLDTLPPKETFHTAIRQSREIPLGLVELYPWANECYTSMGPCKVERMPAGKWRVTIETPGGDWTYEPIDR